MTRYRRRPRRPTVASSRAQSVPQPRPCPRCGENKLDPITARNALSRRDNETYICPDCGTREALDEYFVSQSFGISQRALTIKVLTALASYSYVVGSASRRPLGEVGDIDLLIREKFWPLAKQILGELKPTSGFPLNAKTRMTDPPVEVFVVWHDRLYEHVPATQLVDLEIYGVKFKAWPKGGNDENKKG